MKKAFRTVVYIGSLITLFAVSVSLSGCTSTKCSNSDMIEFPTTEKWWK